MSWKLQGQIVEQQTENLETGQRKKWESFEWNDGIKLIEVDIAYW